MPVGSPMASNPQDSADSDRIVGFSSAEYGTFHRTENSPIAVSCEDKRASDRHYEVIAPPAAEWKEDIPKYCNTIREALQQAEAARCPLLVEHYTSQLERLEMDEVLYHTQCAVQEGRPPPPVEQERASRSTIAWGTRLSLLLNVFLMLIKVYAAIRTGSTTVLASLVDSILDLFSGVILLIVGFLFDRSAPELFPAGKHHFEPLGTLVFACAMFVSATKLLQECANEVANIDTIHFEMDVPSMGVLVLVVVLKGAAAFLCFKYGHGSPALQALAEDHRNDAISNVVAVVGFVCAVHVSVWADPILAFVVTLFILKVWGSQVLAQLHALSGHVAENSFLNAITVLARNHDFRVLQVDTVRAFTSGTGNVVEVDLVLPPDMQLCEAHDIGESLQVFLEQTPALGVDRAYVHLDTETDHDPKMHL